MVFGGKLSSSSNDDTVLQICAWMVGLLSLPIYIIPSSRGAGKCMFSPFWTFFSITFNDYL